MSITAPAIDFARLTPRDIMHLNSVERDLLKRYAISDREHRILQAFGRDSRLRVAEVGRYTGMTNPNLGLSLLSLHRKGYLDRTLEGTEVEGYTYWRTF